MPGERHQGRAQHQFGRTRRPLALALDGLQPLHEAADIKRHAGKFRSHRFQRTIDRDAGGDGAIGKVPHAAAFSFRTACLLRFPGGSDARLQLAARETGKQPFPGCKRLIREEWPATPLLQSHKA
jgi:hypothetical protein